MWLFKDRRDAGQQLASLVEEKVSGENVIILGLPRGGVQVALEVAKALGCPLDVFLVRKLGVPGQEELAMGAVASGGIRVLNKQVIEALNIDESTIEETTLREMEELERRAKVYRGDVPPPDLKGKTVVLVDDGIATGASMKAVIEALKQRGPERIVVAVPLASEDSLYILGKEADEIICIETPEPFYGVGVWYDSFPQNTDTEVCNWLKEIDYR
ncbi:MAG: phosphoribosyltransferase [Spirochaetes bacterium]|nr:MAG: phosphoribosyltransferase [Spirochaetota bacterium]